MEATPNQQVRLTTEHMKACGEVAGQLSMMVGMLNPDILRAFIAGAKHELEGEAVLTPTMTLKELQEKRAELKLTVTILEHALQIRDATQAHINALKRAELVGGTILSSSRG